MWILWGWCLAALLWAVTGNLGPDYHTPDNCQVTSLAGTDLVALLCRLRTINGELDATNFSVIPTRNAVKLRIECSDVLFFPSVLQNRSFVRFRELEELDIEYCKIREVPREAFLGLTNLRNLTLRTYNSDWSATLNIASDAFRDQRSLERIDLGENNIWTLPSALLCDLENLKLLNLSRNKLQDVTVLSFSQAEHICAPGLRSLDVSFNHLVGVPAFAFAALKNLQILNMSLNGISNLEDKALFGMYSLEVLDLSGNLLTALPPELFQENKRLAKLYIRNNSVSVLAPGLFTGLSLLLELELADNQLTNTWVNYETFTDLLSLASLDMSNNKITRLDAATFRDLTNLQVLKLQQNMIETISDNTFSGLFRLHTLVLSHNRIKVISDKTFGGLVGLQVLKLDGNEVFSIDSEALVNSTGLQELQMSHNHLQDVPKVVKSLVSLRTLDLSGNHVSVISNKSFTDLPQLSVLRLAANDIETVTRSVFASLPSLQVLDLASNRISAVEHGAFDNNRHLEAIRLDDNVLTNIQELFSDLPNLQWLNLSKNHLEIFDYSFIPRGLKYLDLRSNNIQELGDYYEIESQLHLKIIDASFNKLSDISASSVPDSAEIIFLNNNLITQVQPYAFFKNENLTKVDLYANKIRNISGIALRMPQMDLSRDMPEFYLGGNPFECDCKMEWLQTINSPKETRQHPTVIDLDSIECRLMNNKGTIPLLEAKKLQFLCEYDSHCLKQCQCCDFDACDCEMTCPSNCTCFHDNSWAANIIECSRAGYDAVPERIPMDSSEVYLDGNALTSLSSHTFIGRRKMRILYLNDSHVDVIHNRTFNGLKSLEILYLHQNRIKELKGYEFEHLTLLRELYLHENELFYIQNTTFLTLASLKVLRLDNNRLKTFPVNMFSKNHNLLSLHLGENPWTCDCEDLRGIQAWLQGVGRQLRDADNIYCALNGSTEIVAQISTYNHSSCSNETETTTIRHEAYLDYVFLPTITLGAFAVLLTITLVVFCNRNRMRVWVYAKYGVRLFYRSEYEGDTDKAFDAFVSYSSKDEVFVTQILAPELERGSPAYKLCLHYRDFPVGAYITDTILSAVETSKRTILILSENFIKSEWCRFEFRSAHHEVLKDRRRRLIVILLGDVPQRDLDPDIRLYLKTNTYLKWGDTHFWEKLKFAMPDAQPPTRNHQLHAISAQQQPGPRPVPLHT